MKRKQRRLKKMASQLLKKTEVYRVDTEEEAMSMIEDAKNGQMNGGYTLTKSSYVLKTKKSKGEIVDQWFITTTEKTFSD
jgi:hypothetical protein